MFNIGDQMVYDVQDALPAETFVQLAGYAAVYTLAFLFLAQFNFRRREI
jgi:hypothetical protein